MLLRLAAGICFGYMVWYFWNERRHLTEVEVPLAHPALQWFGHADPNDPDEQAYLEELKRLRQQDLERTLRELDEECSSSSSTPTT